MWSRMSVAAEPGSKVMDAHGSFLPWAWVSAQRSAALKPCPSARPGVQPERAASRGTGCTEREAWRKLGGSRSEGRWGQRPKHLTDDAGPPARPSLMSQKRHDKAPPLRWSGGAVGGQRDQMSAYSPAVSVSDRVA